MRLISIRASIIFCIFLHFSCGNSSTPKPRGYLRIDFPEKEYRVFNQPSFPYSFQYPVYGKVVDDNSRIAEKYWVNVDFPSYKARIHISYKDARGRLDSLIEDSRTLAYKHAVKADAITEKLYTNPDTRVYGILYNLKGNTASSWQFFVTDSLKHFLRGALYFTVPPNKDSLAPVIDFFGKDLIKLMETVEWKDTDK
jgi:gliding motility-associated lipoprotein GldD